MKYITALSLIVLSLAVMVQCNQVKNNTKVCKVEVTNLSPVDFTDAVIEIPVTEIAKQINPLDTGKLVVLAVNEVVASEVIPGYNNSGTLLAVINIQANQTLNLEIKQDDEKTQAAKITKRTQAELSVREGGEWKMITKKDGKQQYEYQGGQFKNIQQLKVPVEHTDHSFFIRYEGPGWESDKVAYRFYLDWRNAVDIFGKYTPAMVLQNVGLDGFESYHEKCDWGMDIFKVAESLGIGSIGWWDGSKANRVAKTDSVICAISLNGNLKSEVTTNYFGWQTGNTKTNLNSKISIVAGSRLSKMELKADSLLPLLCTGIIKHDGIEAKTNFTDTTSQWVYLTTYGVQSLANDKLGLAIFVQRKYVQQITTDDLNQIVVIKPIDNKAEYYFAAVWEQEHNGLKTSEEFDSYVLNTLHQLNNPLQVLVK